MKYKQFNAELSAKGCYIVRLGAYHDIWFSPITNTKTAILSHAVKEVPTGL